MGVERFFEYDVKDNSCQNFIIDHLQANYLGTDEDFMFLKQDFGSLLEKYADASSKSKSLAKKVFHYERFKYGKPTAKKAQE